MKINVSFEFFPPKAETSIIQLRDTAVILANMRPDFYSVTFGAGGSWAYAAVVAVQAARVSRLVMMVDRIRRISLSSRGMLSLRKMS